MDTQSIFNTSTIFIGIILGLVIYYWYDLRKNHYWKTKNVPSDAPVPLLGSFGGVFKGKAFFQMDLGWYKKHGRVFGAYAGPTPMIFVSDPKLLRMVCVKDFNVFPDRRGVLTEGKIVSSFLTSLKGDDWKRVRSVMTPAFASGKLKKMIKLIAEGAIPTVNYFLKSANSGEPLECKGVFGGFTMDTIASAAFGTKLDSSGDPENVFVQNARSIFNNSFPWRFLIVYLLPTVTKFFGIEALKSSKFFEDLTNSVVEKRKVSNEDRGDFLQLMLDAQKNSGDKESLRFEKEDGVDAKEDPDWESTPTLKQSMKNKTITSMEFVAQCILFFLAGYDTTATALAMTVYYLALNPECQKKVIEEVDRTWKNHPEVDQDALNGMKYVEAAVSETLRLSPSLTRLERRAVEDYQLGDTGIIIPKGMVLAIPIYAMHHDEAFFPNPELYQPERFLAENKDEIQPYTYLPFGAGPRNCIGTRFAMMEIKICLLHVFRSVSFESCPETRVPVDVFRGNLFFQPKAVTLKVNKRKKIDSH